MKFEWELISDNSVNETFRAKVFGGWIVNSVNVSSKSRDVLCESMVFVSDPEWKWSITEY